MNSILIWFRADLRTRDNTALHAAASSARRTDRPLIALCTLCPGQWQRHDWGSMKADFVLRNLAALAADLAALNVPLRVVSTNFFADVPKSVLALARNLNASELHFNREYEINEVRRDDAVREALAGAGIEVIAHHDQCILPPGSCRTNAGGWYTVYSPFRKRWGEVLAETEVGAALPPPKKQEPTGIASDAIPDAMPQFAGHTRPDLWPAGEKAARDRLRAFAAQRIEGYLADRDIPGINGTSTLSPYLSAGVISPRECLRSAIEAGGGIAPKAGPRGKTGPGQWINELVWREFYRHLIVGFPRLCMLRAFKAETELLPWNDDESQFEAWCEGRTGYPIVDAAMRQLNQTGWMHNRLRMIAAMFLTKDLFIDWRRGERYFMSRLVDADLAQNNGGWQWSASTGTDAAPYFRIFNPFSQSRTFDPEGAFIRRFVPELAALDAESIHAPHELPELARAALDYPGPIVDHGAARDRVLTAFKALAAN